MATVLQAYQFALDPAPRTQASLASHAGGALFAYNWGLELVTTRLGQRRAGEDVQVPWTLAELRREWNRAKHEVAPPGGPRTPRRPTTAAWTRWPGH
jgi:putative transposase